MVSEHWTFNFFYISQKLQIQLFLQENCLTSSNCKTAKVECWPKWKKLNNCTDAYMINHVEVFHSFDPKSVFLWRTAAISQHQI